MNKQQAQQIISTFLAQTKSIWGRAGALPSSAGNQMMKDASKSITSKGELNQFAQMVVSSIEKKQKIPDNFFAALVVIAGKVDPRKKALQENIGSWLNSSRNAMRQNAFAAASAAGQPQSIGHQALANNPRYQAVETLRTTQDPSLLFGVFKQGLFPEAESMIPSLLELYPQFKGSVPTTSPPPPPSAPPATIPFSPLDIQQSQMPPYSPPTETNWTMLIVGLVGAGGLFWVAKKNKWI